MSDGKDEPPPAEPPPPPKPPAPSNDVPRRKAPLDHFHGSQDPPKKRGPK